MKFVLLSVSSSKELWADKASELYAKKIDAFFKFEQINLAPKKNARDQASRKIKEDSDLLLGQIKADDFVILFDEGGQSMTSTEFSKELEKILNTGKKRLVFVIGGPFGASQNLKNRSDITISLSKLVFNHLVAKTVALEQIYRAITIFKNIPYHNE